MSADNERELILGGLVGHTPVTNLIPGTVPRPCHKCGRDIWLSPSSQRLKNADPVCLDCALVLGLLAQDAEYRVAPGAIDELRGFLHGEP